MPTQAEWKAMSRAERLQRTAPRLVFSLLGIVLGIHRCGNRPEPPSIGEMLADPDRYGCVLDHPTRVEFLATDGTWGEQSSPGAIRTEVFERAGASATIRSIQLGNRKVDDLSPEQREALQPWMVGDYLLAETWAASCDADRTTTTLR